MKMPGQRFSYLRMSGLMALALCGSLAAAYAWFVYVPDPDPDWQPAIRHQRFSVGELSREFHYYAPDATAPLPIVFVLHGYGGKALDMRRFTAYAFERIAREEGAIVVYPEGYEKHWNDCRGSADYAANTLNVDDPSFFAAMIDWLSREQRGDPRRVLVTGLSNGGDMAYRLALERPALVSAIAPIAANLPVRANRDCVESGAPVPVILFNGTADRINPDRGGVVSILGNSSRGEVMSSLDTIRYFAALAGYSARDPIPQQLPRRDRSDPTQVLVHRWRSLGHVEIALYSIVGGGHSIPSLDGLTPRLLGSTSHQIDAAGESWEFFRRHWNATPAPGAAPRARRILALD